MYERRHSSTGFQVFNPCAVMPSVQVADAIPNIILRFLSYRRQRFVTSHHTRVIISIVATCRLDSYFVITYSLIVVLGLANVTCLKLISGLGHAQKDEFDHGIVNAIDEDGDALLFLQSHIYNGDLPLSKENELPSQKGETTNHNMESNDAFSQAQDNVANFLLSDIDHIIYALKLEPETGSDGKPIESEVKANH